jgi:hypothetical protein
MDPIEYRAALEDMGISPLRAAWLFNGKSERSGRRWAREGAPYHVALIIALMQEFGLTPGYIEVLGKPWRSKEEDNGEEDEEGKEAA